MVPARVAIMSSKTPIHQNSEGVTVEGSIVGSGLKRELKPAQPKARLARACRKENESKQGNEKVCQEKAVETR